MSLYASTQYLAPNSYTVLTAYTNCDVGPTPWYIEIFDQSNGWMATWCSSGSSCSVWVQYPGPWNGNFVAYVSSYGSSNPPPNVQAVSNSVQVHWLGVWLYASQYAAGSGTVVYLTAYASTDVGPSPYYIDIFDQNTGSPVCQVPSGSSCATYVQWYGTMNRGYAAYIASQGNNQSGTGYPPPNVQASSYISVSWNSWSASVYASDRAVAPGSSVTLSAYANYDISNSPYYLDVYDNTTGQYLTECSSGSYCSVSVSSSGPRTDYYIAYIASNYGSSGSPSGIQASSNLAPVTWLAVTLSTAGSYAGVGNWMLFTATANADITYTPWYIDIYDSNANQRLLSCGTGYQCSGYITFYQATTQSFVAYVSNHAGTNAATSNPVTVTWVSLTLSANPTNLQPGSSSTLTATSSIDVGPTPYYINFYVSNGQFLQRCASGASCQISVQNPSPAQYQFVADIAYGGYPGGPYPPDDLVVTSNAATVTWMGVTLTTSSVATFNGSSVTLVATADIDVTTTWWNIEIWNQTSGTRVAVCGSGSVCSTNQTEWATGRLAFIAYIARDYSTYPPSGIVATSSPVYTYWVPAPPVLLIHGYANISGSSSGGPACDPAAPATDACDWSTLKSVLGARGLYPQTEGFYYNDTPNYDDWLDYSDNAQACYGQQFYGGYGTAGDGEAVSPTGRPSHNTEADLRHLAFELAWRIHDLYGTMNVRLVGDSMGGLIIRGMLFAMQSPNGYMSNDPTCRYPSLLNVSDAVTMDTPHNGANVAALGTSKEEQQMVGNNPSNDFLWSMNSSLIGRDPQASGGTDWTVMGSLSDTAVAWQSQLYMGDTNYYVHAMLFESTKTGCTWGFAEFTVSQGHDPCTYGHGEMKQDASTTQDAQAEWRGQWTQSGTNTGWDTIPGDGGDPFTNSGSSQWHGDLWIYNALASGSW